MWCFDRTCWISNISISRGDEVLMIRPLEVLACCLKSETPFYSFGNALWNKEHEYKRFQKLKKESSVLYEWYKELWELPKKVSHYIKANLGTYNDYWWIEEMEEKDGDRDYNVMMFHREIVEKLFKEEMKGKTLEKFIKSSNFYSIFFRKLDFLRINPLDLQLIGQQHKDIEELEAQKDLHSICNKFINKQIKRRYEV